jgi:5-methylcytosine-specific restriction protein B
VKARDRERIYAAADRFVQAALRSDDSLFTPGTPIWTPPALDELHEQFVESPDTSSDAFEVKFERQLSGATPIAIQLAAEILYVHFLIAARMSGQRKRQLIQLVLSWSPDGVSIPPDLDAALDQGLAAPGTAFHTYRPFQLQFIIETARAWKGKSAGEQQALLGDPWAFKEFLVSIPIHAAYSQREAILHLVFPDTFEDIVSRDHKRRIAEAFRDELPRPEQDVDRALLAIRQSLQDQEGGYINFYGTGLIEKWRPPAEREEQAEESVVPRAAWLVRGTDMQGQTLVDRWLTDGYVSIGWPLTGHIDSGTSRKAIRGILEETYPDSRLSSSTGILHRFISGMNVGDLVVAPAGDRIYVGVVTSDVYWAPSDDTDERLCRRRSVEWVNPQQPLSRASLSSGAFSALRTLLTVSNLSEFADEFASRVGLAQAGIVLSARPELVVPAASQGLADELLLPRAWLQDALDLLREKRQLIFYGPPGTGKTYVAQRLASHVTSSGGTYKLVQFHPSYAYEDFVEGYRPRPATEGGGITFELVPGPLRQIADAARDDPAHPYVLIIDEINRGNLAKVFGELYFLLEYRDEVIALQYSPDQEFSLQGNLYVIGTMNTADRSIALVDAAMRRRFYFVSFFPQEEPTAGLLRRWLEREGKGLTPALLLEALNEEIADRDFAIGPSYFMTPRIGEEGELERIWRHAIMPLLEEQFFGADIKVSARFGLEAIRRRVATKQREAEDMAPHPSPSSVDQSASP